MRTLRLSIGALLLGFLAVGVGGWAARFLFIAWTHAGF